MSTNNNPKTPSKQPIKESVRTPVRDTFQKSYAQDSGNTVRNSMPAPDPKTGSGKTGK